MTSTIQAHPRPRPMSAQLRLVHTYIGMLIAPSVIFFAGTGILQIYSLHEAHPGYTPAPLIEKLGKVHKDQRFVAGRKKPAGAAPKAASPDAPHGAEGGDEKGPTAPTALLKLFFAIVAIGLIVSTLIGVWVGLQQRVRRRTGLVLLLIGVGVPVILAALTA